TLGLVALPCFLSLAVFQALPACRPAQQGLAQGLRVLLREKARSRGRQDVRPRSPTGATPWPLLRRPRRGGLWRRPREGGSQDVWTEMAHTPAVGGGAVGVLLDQSGDGADARGRRRGLRRSGRRRDSL